MEKLQELFSKPTTYKFNKEELDFIKTKIVREHYLIKYAFYRKVSSKKCYVTFIIDSYHCSPRRSGVENNWEIICTRPISDIEFDEIIENFGCNIKRFQVFNYKTIEFLIMEDLKYNIQTPQKFIDECMKRGYCEKK